jgi:hypothetical protein
MITFQKVTEQNASSFLSSTNKLLSFSICRMSVEESFVEKLQIQSKEKV